MITFNRRIFYPILYTLFKLQSNGLLFDSKRWSGESCHVQPSAISIPKEIGRSIRDTPPKNRGCTWILFCQNGMVRRRCHHPCLIITDTRHIQKRPGSAGIGTTPQSAPRPASHEKKTSPCFQAYFLLFQFSPKFSVVCIRKRLHPLRFGFGCHATYEIVHYE